MHLTLGFWIVDESAQKSMESEYLEKAKDALDAAGIQIPGKRMEVAAAGGEQGVVGPRAVAA